MRQIKLSRKGPSVGVRKPKKKHARKEVRGRATRVRTRSAAATGRETSSNSNVQSSQSGAGNSSVGDVGDVRGERGGTAGQASAMVWKAELGRRSYDIKRLQEHVATLVSYNRELVLKAKDRELQLKLLQESPTNSKKGYAVDSLASKRRNDKVIRNHKDLYQEFTADGVDIRLHKTFSDMYTRMYVVGKFLSSETSRTWALSMVDHTTYNDLKSSESVMVDWRSAMVLVPSEEDSRDENGLLGWEDLVIFRHTNESNSVSHYIPMCLLRRAQSFPAYAASTYVMTRILSEFGFRHHHGDGTAEQGFATAKEFREECAKSRTLRNRLKIVARNDFANRKRAMRNTYLEMLGYDVSKLGSMKVKKTQATRSTNKSVCAEVSTSRNVVRQSSAGNENGDGKHGIGSDSMVVQRSHADDENIDTYSTDMEMDNVLDKLLPFVVREDGDAVVRHTNAWRTAIHAVIRADESVVEERLDADTVDVLFNNEASRRAFAIFLGPIGNLSGTFSIMQLERADAWMTVILEDLKKKCSGTHQNRGLDTMQLKIRYNFILPHAVCNLQKEIVEKMKVSLRQVPANATFLESELKVYRGDKTIDVLSNMHRFYTVAVLYPPRNLYYIALKPASFNKYICSWLPTTPDCYIGYCPEADTTMVEFGVTELKAHMPEDFENDDLDLEF